MKKTLEEPRVWTDAELRMLRGEPLDIKLYRVMSKCNTGRNRFGSTWNTRSLVRALHAFERAMENEG